MAAPITHIVLADKVWAQFLSSFNKNDFFIGTSFPDIRYLKVINREKTHFKNQSINDIKSDDSIIAGIKFHSIPLSMRLGKNTWYQKIFIHILKIQNMPYNP